MVSKARELLPDPERPVTTVSVLRGMRTLMSRKLCWRAPRTEMWVIGMIGKVGQFQSGTSRLFTGLQHPEGILVVNRNMGQRGGISATIAIIRMGLRATEQARPPGSNRCFAG